MKVFVFEKLFRKSAVVSAFLQQYRGATRQMQIIIQEYKDEYGVSVWDMNDVAEYAAKRGWKLPTPLTPMQLLAKEFAKAAREETRPDEETSEEYRVNHAVFDTHEGQRTLWGDIDRAPRAFMVKSFVQRRQQMVGDAWQLAVDVGRWNRVHANEEAIQVEFDFGPDIEYRRHFPDDNEKAG
uniref:Uncharacterized protein n=1 Tax=mine drainage metagenome TaxID=410659 RepID=E6PCP0_9ZZZZ